MFPIKEHQSKITINLGAYLKGRHLFDVGEKELDFSLFRNYIKKQDHYNLVYHYTHGMCGVLATCLHQMLGWPVVEICDFETAEPLHVGLENPDTGLYVDAFGFEQSFTRFTRRTISHFGSVLLAPARAVDSFIPEAHAKHLYPMCLLEHVPLLFPHLADRVKAIEKEASHGT